MCMNSQTFNISLPRELVKKVDQTASNQYSSRSDLIRSVLVRYLKDLDEWDQIFEFGKKQGRKLGIKSETDVYRMIDEHKTKQKLN